ncbi:prepilin-type N-terminal cleavage/methylation domain-containing protein [Candidatus Dependentiae bacterium]
MKKNAGFTLLEVLLALLILVSSVSIFSSLQLGSIDRLFLGREKIYRSFIIKKNIYKIFFNPPKRDKPIVEKLENPEVKITSEFVDIEKKSKLSPFVDFLRFLKVIGEWKSGTNDESIMFLSLIKKTEKNNNEKI